ncbi:MAG: SMP-30/gluconolactonase/LRE family protein [Acetobacteraceae bacterium]|nr:SMP-30/gluconolactonase/LRE family protein [Acetobacteraceae bacterium]
MWSTPLAEVSTHVLTRMPDHLRRMQRSEWADANRAGAPIDCFLEGPCFDAAGRLHVVDIPYGRIFRIEGDTWTQLAEYDGWPNGLQVCPDGSLLAADYRRGLMRIDPATGAASPVLQTVMSEGFKGLNDLVLHPDGSVLFTDQGQTGLQDPSGRVWRLHPDGRLDRLIGTGPSPNGIALNAAQTHVYVAMTRSCEVWRFLLRPDAVVAKAQCFASVPPGTSGPDGLAVDSADRLYVANPGHGCVWVVDAHGVPRYRIDSCSGRSTTNCAITPDGGSLVITESDSGSILICEVPAP